MNRKPYACSTLQPDYVEPQDTFLVQDGYIEIKNKSGLVVGKQPRYVYMRNRMSRDCKYDRIETDPQCEGCERGRRALEEKKQKEQEQYENAFCRRDDYYSMVLKESIERSIKRDEKRSKEERKTIMENLRAMIGRKWS